MSIDFENRTRIFNTNIEGLFKEMASSFAAEAEQARETLVAAYEQDLREFARKTKALDDIVGIAKITQTTAEHSEADVLRKILQVLNSQGLL